MRSKINSYGKTWHTWHSRRAPRPATPCRWASRCWRGRSIAMGNCSSRWLHNATGPSRCPPQNAAPTVKILCRWQSHKRAWMHCMHIFQMPNPFLASRTQGATTLEPRRGPAAHVQQAQTWCTCLAMHSSHEELAMQLAACAHHALVTHADGKRFPAALAGQLGAAKASGAKEQTPRARTHRACA